VIRRVGMYGVLLLLVVLATVPLWAQQPPQFSSDLKFTGARGASTGKLFYGGEKVRMDLNAQGRDSIIINDLSRKVGYMLMPQQKMYMEMNTEGQGGRRGPDWRVYDAANPCANVPDTTCQKIGADTVDGRLCNKWQFTGKNSPLNRTVWIDEKSGIPIKSAMGDGSTVELTNIKEGPQNTSLFEIPAGYQKFDMGNMMQNFPRPH
jgi:uncharacterized protein DUF4412